MPSRTDIPISSRHAAKRTGGGGGWHLMPAPVVAQKLSTVARVRPGFHPGYVLEGTRQ